MVLSLPPQPEHSSALLTPEQLAANLVHTACPSSPKQTQSFFQNTKFERLTGHISGVHLTPEQAANWLVPDLVPFLYLEHLPAEAGFGPHTRVSLNVAHTDIPYAAIEAQGFYYLNHHFSSAELKHAVKLAYPERFI